MIHCIYHPSDKMRVVETDEFERLLGTGEWFGHPTEAKNRRLENENKLSNDEKRSKQGRRSNSNESKKTRVRALEPEQLCEVRTDEDEAHGRERAEM